MNVKHRKISMKLNLLLEKHPLILTEAAIVEALSHTCPALLHPALFNAPMVETEKGRQALKTLYLSFLEVAREFHLPFVITTPTWRADQERLVRAGASMDLNEKAVAFLREIRDEADGETAVSLGGILGCKNDCYRPDLALAPEPAREFHAWQARRLAAAQADFLMAVTLPAVDEALGMAMAMADTGLPYIISFVINRNGEVLDRTPLARAVDILDNALPCPPLGYMVNCAHPTFLNADTQPKGLFSRLIGFQANGSSLDHDQLDRAPEPRISDIREWAEQMIRLNRVFGVKILGGCCGTRTDHLACIARGISRS